MSDTTGDITELLQRIAVGDRDAENRLFQRVYDELHDLASFKMMRSSQREEHSLQTTALVNEAYLRIKDSVDFANVQNRRHFFGIAGRVMQQILFDRYRKRQAERAGGQFQRVPWDDVLDDVERSVAGDYAALHEALEALDQANNLAADVVRRRFFCGQNYHEISADLQLSISTAEKAWRFARAWLFQELSDANGSLEL